MSGPFKKFALLALLLWLISFAGFAFASSSLASATKQQVLDSAAIQIGCKTNFTVTFINYIVTDVPGLSSLDSQATALQQEDAQLQTYASSENITNYRNYVQNTYDPSLKQLRQAIPGSFKDSEPSSNTIMLLRGQYDTTLNTYKGCAFNAEKQFAIAKGTAYVAFMTYYQQKIQNLSSEDLDTTALTTLVDNADSEIVTPYQSAVNAATTQSELNAALAQYCLFDGCKNGTNFHLAANFDTLKLTAMYGKIAAIPNLTSNQTATLARIHSDLGSASSALSSVGTSQYTQNSRQSVFGALNQTVIDIKNLRKS